MHYLRIESTPEAKTIVSGQTYLLNCIITLSQQNTADIHSEAITVQWLNSTQNGSYSQIISDHYIYVGNLTAIGPLQYSYSLHFLMAETYHSGEYVCRSEYDEIIRKVLVNISFERTFLSANCM